MYKLNNISLADFGIIPSRATDSSIALAGFLDMPKRMGTTYYSWGDENGVEPYVAANEIYFEGRDIEFYGLIKATSKANAFELLTGFNELLNSLETLVNFETPYGTFSVYVKDEITITYSGNGWCSIKMVMREPIVKKHINFLAPGFISSGFIATEYNGIIINYPTPIYNVYGIDGIPFIEIGCFVKKVEGNFNRSETKGQTLTNSTTVEVYQLTKTDLQKIKLELFFIAETFENLKQNIAAFYVLLAKENLRNIQVDGRTLEAFAVDGFTVENIKSTSNLSTAELTTELIII